jgi:hypothetical protein
MPTKHRGLHLAQKMEKAEESQIFPVTTPDGTIHTDCSSMTFSKIVQCTIFTKVQNETDKYSSLLRFLHIKWENFNKVEI